MEDLRTKKTHEKYMKVRAQKTFNHTCRLCKIKPIKDFKYWKIIDNEYPWDLIAKTNHMLVPKRHVVYEELNIIEKKELDLIKSNYVNKKYEIIAEATNRKKSIPSHFHVHLLVLRND